MASRGRKPQPPGLQLIKGNPGKRPLPEGELEMRESPLKPHRELDPDEKLLWDRFINTAWWLNDHDAPKAYMWVSLQSQFDSDPKGMTASMISNLRYVGSELGLDPAARTRMAGSPAGASNPADEFFD